jgi:hypothetical protein
MTAQKKRRDPDFGASEITAQPRRARRGRRASHEPGLAVDPDDLGTEFLSEAIEQGNFESERDTELSLGGPPPSDEADADYDPNASVWDETVRRGPNSDIREVTDPALSDDDPLERHAEDPQDRPTPVDVHQRRIVAASLFDEEADEPGEVRSPKVETDDGG